MPDEHPPFDAPPSEASDAGSSRPRDPRPPSLKYQLQTILKHNRDGSFATQRRREQALLKFLDDLRRQDGWHLNQLHNLKPKHIQSRVAAWIEEGQSVSSMKTQMGFVRWLARKIGKPRMPPSNDQLQLGYRSTSGQNRAWDDGSGAELLAAVKARSERLCLQMRLMRAFGLRFREAATLRPHENDRGAILQVIYGTKGGRPRIVPILHGAQRALLEEVKGFVDRGASMIPDDLNFDQWRQQAKSIARALGLNKGRRTHHHGLRHRYGQCRYVQLTGFEPPCRMTSEQRSAVSPDMIRLDHEARGIIARELGHGRTSVTTVYLGAPLR